MIFESGLPIQILGRDVRPFDFQMERPDAEITARRLDEPHRGPPNTHPPVTGPDEQFIDESITPVIFEAIPEREGDVANRLHSVQDQPEAPEQGIAKEALQCAPRHLLIKREVIMDIVCVHEFQDELGIGAIREPKRWFHVCLPFVQRSLCTVRL